MASSSVSNMDPAYLAQQYTQIERSSKDALLASKQNDVNTELKGFTALRSSMTEFSDLLDELQDSDGILANSASISDDTVASVTADSKAASGTYEIYVDQLAQSHQLSMQFANDSVLPTSGDLGISLAGEEFVINLSELSADASLSELASLINNTAEGVSASVMKSGDSQYLVMTSDDTGAENQIALNYNGANADFSNALANTQELSAAQDAQIRIGSSSAITITSSANEMTDVIEGVTINLTKAQQADDGPVKLTVGDDVDKTAKNLQQLVDKYNGIWDQLNKDDIASDSMSRSLKSTLRGSFQGMFEGKTLLSVGIEFNRDGKMELDKDKLSTTLEENPSQISDMLAGENGALTKLSSALEPYSERFGFLKDKVDNLQTRLGRVEQQQTDFDARMDKVYQRYLNQFTQMQVTISQLESSMSSLSSD